MSGQLPSDGERLLESQHCRWFLYCLYLYETPIKLAGVADQLAIWDPHVDENNYLQERFRIYDSLYYDHLPELRKAGLGDYSQRDDMIGLGPAAKEYESMVIEEFSTEITDLLAEEQSTFDTMRL